MGTWHEFGRREAVTASQTKQRADRARRTWDEADDYPERLPRRRWPVVLVFALLAALLGGAGLVVWASPVLGLRTVEVQGSGAPDLAPQVRAAVDVPLGTPLIRIDPAAVRARVATVGPVASVQVVRSWPHALVVTVTERLPLAVTQADGRWWLLDATGKPYEQVAEPPADLMPLELATPGEGDRATLAALGVLGSLTPEIRDQVRTISAPHAYDISLTLTHGRTVLWGANSDNATKMEVLPALLKRPGRTYDITDPTLATVR
jgi:cell division protein FtsQ